MVLENIGGGRDRVVSASSRGGQAHLAETGQSDAGDCAKRLRFHGFAVPFLIGCRCGSRRFGSGGDGEISACLAALTLIGGVAAAEGVIGTLMA